MSVKAWSQRDPRWADVRLGSSGEFTIGGAGCLVTCMASILSDLVRPVDPEELNAWLMTNLGYVDGHLFLFESVQPLGVELIEWVDCAIQPAPIARMASMAAQGHGIAALVNFKASTRAEMHWVRLADLTSFGGEIMDPWRVPGREIQPLGQYLEQGWTPAKGIFLAAIYRQAGERRKISDRGLRQSRMHLWRPRSGMLAAEWDWVETQTARVEWG